MTGAGLGRWRNRNATEISADPERALEIGWPCRVVRPGGAPLDGDCPWRMRWLSTAKTLPRAGINWGSSAARPPGSRRKALSTPKGLHSTLQHGLEAIVESGQRCHPCVMLLKCLVWFSVVSLTTVTLQGTIFLYLLCRKSHSSELTYGYLLHRLFTLQPRRDFPIALPPHYSTHQNTVWQAKPWEWR